MKNYSVSINFAILTKDVYSVNAANVNPFNSMTCFNSSGIF